MGRVSQIEKVGVFSKDRDPQLRDARDPGNDFFSMEGVSYFLFNGSQENRGLKP